MLRRVAIGLAITAAMAVPSSASAAVRLAIDDGRIWLTADHATVADILAEWARVGSTQMMNAERLTTPLLTLDLRGVPELDALEVIMRAAGGFVTVSRIGGVDATHLSRFSRVVIVPATSAGGTPMRALPPAPVYAPPPTVHAPTITPSGAQRVIGPDGQPVADDQEDAPPPSQQPPPAVMPGGSMPPGFSEPPGAAAPRGAARPGLMPPLIPPRRPGGATAA